MNRPLPSHETPPLHGDPQAFGREAVDTLHRQARYIATGEHDYDSRIDPYEDISPQMAELAYNSIEDERLAISGLSWVRRHQVASRLGLEDMPDSLQQLLKNNDQQSGTSSYRLLRRLVAKDEDGFVIPAAAAANVAQWHNQNLSDKQVTFQAEVVAPLKEAFKASVHQAVDGGNGWMPAVAEERLAELDQATIYLNDGLQTVARGRKGKVDETPEGAVVTLDPKARPTTRRHELVHVIAGGGLLALTVDQEETTKKYIDRDTLLHGDGSPASLLIAEATTDLIRVGLDEGSVPDLRKIHRGISYREGWRLMRALATYGKHDVDPQLFVNAHMESPMDRLMRDEHSELAKLQQALKAAFPTRDILEDLRKVDGALNSAYQKADIAVFTGVLKKAGKKTL